VKACSDGAQAVAEAASIRPDVIVLDIEMPHMDGLSALPQLRKAAPDARIIMASTLTAAGATQTVKALALGAIRLHRQAASRRLRQRRHLPPRTHRQDCRPRRAGRDTL
jgi:chemotaxis response regulator CheB